MCNKIFKNNISKTNTLLLLLLVITLCSCAGVAPLTAERPRDEAFRTMLKKELSTLNVSVDASTDDLAKVLNKTVNKNLYKGSTKTRGVAADVVRNGTIVVTASDDFIYVSLPVSMSLGYGMFETKAIAFTLKFKIKPGISADWQLQTEIAYLGLSDLLAEEVGIGPVAFKPRSVVEGITQPVQKMLSNLIAQKINDQFPLKAQIGKVWNLAQKPMQLDKSYNAWLKLTPSEVMLSPLTAQNNRVRISVGISTFAELVVGPEPPARPLLPLPRLKPVNSFDKTFRIALNADLFYKDIRAIAAPLLLNKRFESDGKNIVIKDFDLYGNGDRLVVKLQTQGALDGVFYLTARPLFNPQTNNFSVEDVDFDLQTQNLLHQSADWFLHGTIREMIQEKLNMNLGRQLEQSRQVAGKALARVQLVEHLSLKGDIKNLKFSDMIVLKDKMSLQVYAEGEAGVLLQ